MFTGGVSAAAGTADDPEWVPTSRTMCRGRVPFFHKQWGGTTPIAGGSDLDGVFWDGGQDTLPSELTPLGSLNR